MASTTKKKIQFILPGFLNVSRNEILINIYEKYPHVPVDNSCIHSFFGNFPSCNWNGGRLCLGERYSTKQMKKIRDFHNKKGIAIALTMTNLILEEKDLENKYCNDIMKIFNNGKNEVLISTELLEDYIRENYKDIKINRSITSKIDPLKTLNKYNLSLIPSQHSSNEEYISKIPLEFRKNIEILCDDPCVTDCKWKYSHYEELCNLQLGNYHKKTSDTYGNCKQRNNQIFNFYANTRKEALYLAPNKLQYMIDKYDINHFKINGREKFEYFGYDNIVEFTIKDEYKDDVLTYMLERAMLEFEEEVVYQTHKYGVYDGENGSLWHERMDLSASR